MSQLKRVLKIHIYFEVQGSPPGRAHGGVALELKISAQRLTEEANTIPVLEHIV